MKPFHYYGDSVRLLFLAGGAIMLLTLPMFNPLLPVSALVSLLLVILLVLSAGMTNPLEERSATIDMIISGIALVGFGYNAVAQYPLRIVSGTAWWLFWINLLLAVIFFIAFYYSLKTVRGFKRESRFKYSD